MPDFPDVPTAAEQGVPCVVVGWRGLAAPKETPDEIAQLLEKECAAIAGSDEYREFMEKLGYNITVRDSDQFRTFLGQQDAMWKDVISQAGFAASP